MADPDVTAPKPVVFKARGVEIDTRLKVFDTVFHVSSTILKMHSQYFFKFLDSADKVIGTGHGDFKYDWVTKIVDDGKDWQLVAAGTSVRCSMQRCRVSIHDDFDVFNGLQLTI